CSPGSAFPSRARAFTRTTMGHRPASGSPVIERTPLGARRNRRAASPPPARRNQRAVNPPLARRNQRATSPPPARRNRPVGRLRQPPVRRRRPAPV
ncbi:uncharacterized protein METZ01_LOCUS240536, partial [marine metagenome]